MENNNMINMPHVMKIDNKKLMTPEKSDYSPKIIKKDNKLIISD
jgi:hypothetical protein